MPSDFARHGPIDRSRQGARSRRGAGGLVAASALAAAILVSSPGCEDSENFFAGHGAGGAAGSGGAAGVAGAAGNAGGAIDGGAAGSGGKTGPTPCTPDICGPITYPPPVPPADGVTAVTLAVTRLYVGDTDRQGVADGQAWTEYGLDLDGKHFESTKTPGHCQPAAGAKPGDVVEDAPSGVDNSFGKNVLPILMALELDWAAHAQLAIDAGLGTWVFQVRGLGTPGQNSLSSPLLPSTLSAALGATEGDAPVAPGADWSTYTWRPLGTPKRAWLAQGMVGGTGAGTWWSGPPRDLTLRFGPADHPLVLTLHRAVISFDLTPDHLGGTSGNVGGVVDADELTEAVVTTVGSYFSCYSPEPLVALQGIAQQIRQAADIRKDGTQDPGAICDGTSIGLGFELTRSNLSDTLADAPEPTFACEP